MATTVPDWQRASSCWTDTPNRTLCVHARREGSIACVCWLLRMSAVAGGGLLGVPVGTRGSCCGGAGRACCELVSCVELGGGDGVKLAGGVLDSSDDDVSELTAAVVGDSEVR